MSDIVILGSPRSNFVWTARLACEEKGVPHTLEAVGTNTRDDLKTPDHLKLHPFGRIPVMRHGDFVLYESSAICRYVDEAFDGPALQPEDLQSRARMNQWISATCDYLVKDIVWNYVVQFAFPSGPDGAPDMARIEEAKPIVRQDVEIVDRALGDHAFLAGEDISIADFLLTPILTYLGNTPNGLVFFDGLENLGRWWQAVSTRPSFAATKPPLPGELSDAA